MTYDEAIELLTQIGSRWPAFSKNATEESTERWARDLMNLDYEVAHRAVVRLHQSLLFPPAWAQFFETYRSLKTPERRPEPVGVMVPTESAKERIKSLRADLSRSKRWPAI